MKKLSITGLFILSVCLSTFYSCSKSNSSPSTDPVNTDTFTAIVTTGTWRITNMTEPGQNNTAKFSGYTFSFLKDGKITAVSSGKTTSGTWAWSGTSYYGVNINKPIFSINLGNDDPVRRLSHNWVVEQKSENAFTLGSSEPAEDEHVTFTKL